jgi:ADP-ribosyl-[dinitrogen reductase] hydrolase
MVATSGQYGRELSIATELAVEAGRILRDEFHYPGGPRGSGGHAAADERAEDLIRRGLTEAFPEHAYRGEETGYSPGSGPSSSCLWLVDPNDGTSAYLQGFRGAAVSIGMLHHGRPVLGVVYAYCAPDDGGDLFTWAEGSGGIRRNGQEVYRQWPALPGPDCTVLVSHHADKSSQANARVSHPMRFRAIPSIAYRLALVAAGEGDLAVSLNGPCGWDYAGGHALLLGAGGDLFDAGGHPITYTAEGASGCRGRCFGGPLSLAVEAASRDWGSVLHRHPAEIADLRLSWPIPGRALPNPGTLSRAQGCLLGQLAGDSLGGLVEFQTPREIAAQYPQGARTLADGGTWSTLAGQPTDDSEMALALARSIVQSGHYDVEAAARAYAWWHDSGPFDMGSTTQSALGPAASAVRDRQSVAEAARRAAKTGSEANGALMRVSPLGVAGAGLPPGVVAEWARADAELTHPHPVCQAANAVFAEAIAFAIRTGATPDEIYRHALATAADMRAPGPVQDALTLARDVPPLDYTTQQGWVLIALQNAFFQLLHAASLEEGVVDTVMSGGDTDTNAAIAGALLGAVHGREAVPLQWLDRILTCRPIAGLPGVKHPRPEAFWPVDALWLAELLITAAGPCSSSGGEWGLARES